MTCGCASRSSATSSIVTMRSSAATNADSAPSVVVLPEPGAAAHEDVAARADRVAQQVAQRRRSTSQFDQVLGAQRAAAEAPDRQRRAVQRQRRDHDVDARAVRQARVAERLGLVDAAPQRREDPLDRVQQLGLVGERDLRRLEPAAALDPDRPRAADHDLVDRRGRRAATRAARGRTSAARRGARAPRDSPRRGCRRARRRARGSAPDVALLSVLAGARDQLVAQRSGEDLEIVSWCHAGTRPARR